VPLEFDMAIAVRRSDKELQQRLEKVIHDQRDALRAVLTDFGVPLVQCDDCIISGDLPAHGPYKEPAPEQTTASDAKPVVTIAMVDGWLAHGANIKVELSNAVLADDRARVAHLIEQKHAPVDGQDLQGETPLHHALVMRYHDMVDYLIGHGADVNGRDRDGWTPIMTAAWADDAASVKVLASHGADPNAVSAQNLTPLGIASQYGKNAAALALINAGADPGKPVGEGGYTPLMLATAGHAPDLVQALIQKGADVNARNSGGVTALMIAAANGQADMVTLLVHAGANVKAQTERGDTALSIAQAKGHDAVVKLLSGAAPGA
jgi:ankyrin repeat protein